MTSAATGTPTTPAALLDTIEDELRRTGA